MTKGSFTVLTEGWMSRGHDIQATPLHPAVYLVPSDALVVALVQAYWDSCSVIGIKMVTCGRDSGAYVASYCLGRMLRSALH